MCQLVQNFDPDRNVYWRDCLETDIHVPQKINLNNFGDPLTLFSEIVLTIAFTMLTC